MDKSSVINIIERIKGYARYLKGTYVTDTGSPPIGYHEDLDPAVAGLLAALYREREVWYKYY